MEEEKANANSELRYIALELTKMAHTQKKSFRIVASEFVNNVYELKTLLRSAPSAHTITKKTKKKQRA